MIASDEDQFYTELSTACQVVGRPPLTEAAAKMFFNRLSCYSFDWVQWGLSEATDHCKTGWDFNVALVKKMIDSKQKINKFRADAEMLLENQSKKSIEQKEYIESDEYKANQEKGSDCFKELRGLMDGI